MMQTEKEMGNRKETEIIYYIELKVFIVKNN